MTLCGAFVCQRCVVDVVDFGFETPAGPPTTSSRSSVTSVTNPLQAKTYFLDMPKIGCNTFFVARYAEPICASLIFVGLYESVRVPTRIRLRILRTDDGVHCRESVGAGSIVLKVAREACAFYSGNSIDQYMCTSLLPRPLFGTTTMAVPGNIIFIMYLY